MWAAAASRTASPAGIASLHNKYRIEEDSKGPCSMASGTGASTADLTAHLGDEPGLQKTTAHSPLPEA